MSLWADYITELRYGTCKFIEYPWGFISYSVPEGGDCIFLEDIYIVPEHRDAARAYRLLSEVNAIGLELNKVNSVFIVRVDTPEASKNLRMYIAMGFTVSAADAGSIWLKRAITKEE